MESTKAIVEIHHFSGGLKTNIIGVRDRPDWIPDSDQVGLHNDIYLKENEFVIEFSRHKRKDKLISWIGVYSYGKDAVYGDRANYIGVGVWLTNYIPLNSYLLVDALVKICQLLVKNGPDENVKSSCKNLLDDKSFLQSWIKDITLLPRENEGIVFDVTQHPKTIYIQSTNQDINKNIKKIADSILLNCIKAEDYVKSSSRILYLLLDPSSKINNINNITTFSENPNPIKQVLEYFFKSIEDIKNHNIEINNLYLDLENKNKSLELDNSGSSSQIKQLLEECEKLRTDNQDVNKNLTRLKLTNKELSDELNTLSKKSESELLNDLGLKIIQIINNLENVKSKTDVYINTLHNSYNNSNVEILTRIKDLSNQIKEQKNTTASSSFKVNSPSAADLSKRPNVDQYRRRESFFDNIYVIISGLLVFIALVVVIYFQVFFDEPKIEANIQQQEMSHIDLNMLKTKIDDLSSKVTGIESLIIHRSDVEEDTPISSSSSESIPLNDKKNEHNKRLKK